MYDGMPALLVADPSVQVGAIVHFAFRPPSTHAGKRVLRRSAGGGLRKAAAAVQLALNNVEACQTAVSCNSMLGASGSHHTSAGLGGGAAAAAFPAVLRAG